MRSGDSPDGYVVQLQPKTGKCSWEDPCALQLLRLRGLGSGREEAQMGAG